MRRYVRRAKLRQGEATARLELETSSAAVSGKAEAVQWQHPGAGVDTKGPRTRLARVTSRWRFHRPAQGAECSGGNGGLRAWSHAGYSPWRTAPIDMLVTVLTPMPTVAALRAGN